MEEISHLSHEHRLGLSSANHPYYCKGCDQLGFGQSYICSITKCNFFLHKQCGNPKLQVKYPFSTKCVMKFHNKGSGEGCLCDVCGKKIKGYNYRCLCSFVKRNVHPFCLSYEQTLVAVDSLTLNLKKVAAAKCLHCKSKHLTSKDPGWAYVSPCESYCYHVACVMDIINNIWKNGLSEDFDPNQIINKEFPADMHTRQQLVGVNKNGISKTMKVTTALSMMFKVLPGNPLGLIGDARISYFSK